MILTSWEPNKSKPRGIVYGLCDPRTNELRYVGKTELKLSMRLRGHLSRKGTERPTRRSCWIKSLLLRGLKPDAFVIEEVAKVDMNDAEEFWIAYFRSIGADLTNGTKGGDGGATRKGFKLEPHVLKARTEGKAKWLANGEKPNYQLSDSGRRRISEWMASRVISEETRRQMSVSAKVRSLSEEGQANLKNARSRRKHGPRPWAGAKISAGKKGVFTERMKAQIARLNAMPRLPTSQETKEKIRRSIAKLDWCKVRELRARWAAGERNKARLGREYGISPRNVRAIVLNETWKEECS